MRNSTPRLSRPWGPARRALWRWWPDRNPLRRRADRIERTLMVLLLALFVPLAAGAALAVGHAAAGSAQRVAHAQQATWHPVPAHLERSAPDPLGPADPASYLTHEPAWWIAPDGVRRAGDVLVAAGSKAGTTVTVWTDSAGRLTGRPIQGTQVTARAGLAILGALAVLAAFMVIVALAVRRVLDGRRLAGWEADWAAIGPQWTGSR
jgi:hypothetical protein